MARPVRVRACLGVVVLLVLVTSAQAENPGVPVIAAQGSVQVAFPPWDDAESLLVDTLGRAQREILVQAYLLTSRPSPLA